MTTDSNDSAFLDGLFAAARAAPAQPTAALMVRVQADAQAELTAVRAHLVHPVTRRPRQGRVAKFCEALGGWPAIGGLVAATVAGIWIGFNPPRPVEAFTTAFFETDAPALWIDAETVLAMGLGEEVM